MKGIDCSVPLTAKSAVAIAAAGYGFAARYLVPEGYKKYISKAEAQLISDAGMQIISVFETTAARPLGGDTAGKGDAQVALNCARKIGQPNGTAIYFCADFDVTKPSQFDLVENYLRAATTVLGDEYAVGIYGEYAVIEEMAKRKACKHFWQTYAWSGGKRSLNANLYQWKNGQSVAGVTVDLNESFGNEGWWNYKTVKVDPPELQTVKVIVNGIPVTDFIEKDGRIYVQLKALEDALGAKVNWDASTKTASLTLTL